MNCTTCDTKAKRNGKDRKGNQRFQCLVCNKTFAEPKEKPLDEMRLPLDKALSVLHHLVEGCSIRSTERITGVEKRTILNLFLLVGERCEKLLEDRIQGIPVKDVQCDEIWCFVGMKEKTKGKKRLQWDSYEQERSLGDAYTFVAIERHTKLVLTWHLGRRTFEDTWAFTKKLDRATADQNFQISTDGFAQYRDTIVHELGHKNIDFAQLIKVYATAQTDEHRYSDRQWSWTV